MVQVVDSYLLCAPGHWSSAAASVWKFLNYAPAGSSMTQDISVPLQRSLLQVVATAQRLQVDHPENQTHTSGWSATHLTPVLALLASTRDRCITALCEEAIHASIVALGLHSGEHALVGCLSLVIRHCYTVSHVTCVSSEISSESAHRLQPSLLLQICSTLCAGHLSVDPT